MFTLWPNGPRRTAVNHFRSSISTAVKGLIDVEQTNDSFGWLCNSPPLPLAPCPTEQHCMFVVCQLTGTHAIWLIANPRMKIHFVWNRLGDDSASRSGDSEDGEEPSPSCGDYIMHFLTLFWKILFAFIPPTGKLNHFRPWYVHVKIVFTCDHSKGNVHRASCTCTNEPRTGNEWLHDESNNSFIIYYYDYVKP